MTPLLFSVDLIDINLAPASWLAMSAHSRIKNLKMRCTSVDTLDLPVFWRVCEKLEATVLQQCDARSITQVDEAADSSMPKIRGRELDHCRVHGCQARNVDPSSYPEAVLATPHLDKLMIDCNLQDADMAFILENVGNGHGNIVRL
jgi:hypothetical protein